MACKRLIYRVIYYFINQVVQAFYAYIANIHRRALTHCFQSF